MVKRTFDWKGATWKR